MESREAKLIVNRSGSGSSTFRATLPTAWVRQLGLNEENRDIKLIYKEDKIIIKNNKEELEMLKNIIKDVMAELEKIIKERGYLEDSDNTQRDIDTIIYDLIEDTEIEFDDVYDEVKDLAEEKYNKVYNLSANGYYEGYYYSKELNFDDLKEFYSHFELDY